MDLKLLIAFVALFAGPCYSATNIVCYFTSWTTYRPGDGKFNASNVPADLCTHVHYGFVGLDWNSTLWVLDDWEADGLGELNHLKRKRDENPSLKLIISMGGWNEGSQKYSETAADPAKRRNLVNSVVAFLHKTGFDGFDLDWEYPSLRGGKDVDVENFITLLRELKEALRPNGWSLSVAVSGGIATANISYDFQQLTQIVDLINVMTYDYHGAFEPFVGHYAPLKPSHLDQTELQKGLNVMSGINFWIEQGVPLEKLTLGVGTYGRCFTLADPRNTSLYAPTVGVGCNAGPYTRQEGTLGYNEICSLLKDYEYVWDDEQEVPHLVKGNQWVGFDNKRSLKLKAEYAKSLGLSGVMIWSLDTDDFRGLCGEGEYPLINTLKSVFDQ